MISQLERAIPAPGEALRSEILFRQMHCLRCGGSISEVRAIPPVDIMADAAVAVRCSCRNKHDVLSLSRIALLRTDFVDLLYVFARRYGYTLGALSLAERWSVLESQLAATT